MTVLVCGGRDYTDKKRVFEFLNEFKKKNVIGVLVHGDCRGADRLAGNWARHCGIQEVICPANWNFWGKSAGSKRNLCMFRLNPDVVIAFPGGPGTKDMMKKTRDRQIELVVVDG